MPRVLKFRAWASQDGELRCYKTGLDCPFMLNLNGDLVHVGGVEEDRKMSETMFARIAFNDITIEQFTGLHDADGKEIFEGDILDFPYVEPLYENIPKQVMFRHGGFGWKDAHFVPFDTCVHLWNTGNIPRVVGNIHEHPELLEVAK